MSKFVSGFKGQFKSWNKYELAYGVIVISTLLLISSLTVSVDEGIFIAVISVLAGFFGVLGTLLAAKRNIWNYFWGIIHILLYAIVSFASGIYGDFMLNIFFFLPTNIYAIKIWGESKDSLGLVKSKKLTLNKKLIILISTILSYFLYSFFLIWIGDTLPWIDSASTVLSVVGMFLMMYAYREQYIVWTMVNIVSFIMWLIVLLMGNTTAIPLVIMWFTYILSGLWGVYNWYKKPKYVGYTGMTKYENGSKAIYK